MKMQIMVHLNKQYAIMNKLTKYIITTILFLAIALLDVFSQFEQKFTLNFTIGYIRPVGENEYTNIKTRYPNRFYLVDGTGTTEFAYIYPYVMSNFDPGILLSGGVQYNINRRISIAANIGYFNLWSWSYEYSYLDLDFDTEPVVEDWLAWEISNWDLGDEDEDYEVVESGEDEYNLFNLSFGIAPKVYLLPGSSFNPFLFSEFNFDYTSLNYDDKETEAYTSYGIEPEWNPLTEMIDKSIGYGVYPGAGVDISLSDNLGMYVQGGYSIIFINSSEMEDNGLEPENFKTIRVEAGIKISFLKSKNL